MFLKKSMALFLSGALLVGVTGCGTTAQNPDPKAVETTKAAAAATSASGEATSAEATKTAGATEANTLPIVSEPLTLTLFCSPPDARAANNIGELETMKKVEELTGIHIEFQHPSATDKGEALATMLASGDYPDMIRSNFATYKGGIEGAMNDGIVIDYTDIVRDNAPNYNAMVAANGMEKLVSSDTGKQICFGSSFAPANYIGKSFAGLFLRQDWLDELGLEVPTTIDEWHTVLTAFKEKKNCEAPFGAAHLFAAASDPNVRAQAFAGSYGAAFTFMLKNDEVKYGPVQPEFKTFLQTFSQWYAEGLIDKDFATHNYDKNTVPMFAAGQVGAIVSHPVYVSRIYEMVDKAKNPNFKMVPAPWPQIVKGEECPYRPIYAGVSINPILVSTSSKNPVECVKFVDFLYSQQGIDLCTWGIREGETYTINEKGEHVLGPMITANPDGLGVQDARNKYTLNSLQLQWNWEYEKQQYSLPEHQNSTWGLWSSTSSGKNFIPTMITMTGDETTAVSNVMAQVDPYAQEMILKYIMGLESLDSFDKFASTIQSMGIENAEKAQQAAYTRFKNR